MPATEQQRPAPPSSLSEAAFRRLAAERLLHDLPEAFADTAQAVAHGASDFDLNPELGRTLLAATQPRPAAVLVPVIARDPLTVLFTVRTDHLPSHAGQISFPGGKVDAGDATPLDTALREAEEEIGLMPSEVEPLGFLDVYRTGTGYRILPVVGLVAATCRPRPNPGEVADVFEVPLSFLMDATNHARHARVWQGVERYYHAMPYGDRYIWGATAGMLKNLHARLFAK